MENKPDLQQNNFDLGKATEQIKLLKKDMGKSIIAIGKWLLFVKENIPRGEWMDWLKYEVNIPYVQSWRYIKIAKEVDYETLEKVGYRKMVEILELPASKFREQLIEVAQGFSREEIENIKEPGNHSDTEVLSAVVSPEADADVALDANATLLDALGRLKISEIPENYIDFLESQLHETPAKVKKFLEELKNGRQK